MGEPQQLIGGWQIMMGRAIDSDPNAHSFRRLLKRRIDPDTRITSEKVVVIHEIAVLLETWTFDGIRGASAVFLSSDVAQFPAIIDDQPLSRVPRRRATASTARPPRQRADAEGSGTGA